jgi:hypothetical protein
MSGLDPPNLKRLKEVLVEALILVASRAYLCPGRDTMLIINFQVSLRLHLRGPLQKRLQCQNAQIASTFFLPWLRFIHISEK